MYDDGFWRRIEGARARALGSEVGPAAPASTGMCSPDTGSGCRVGRLSPIHDASHDQWSRGVLSEGEPVHAVKLAEKGTQSGIGVDARSGPSRVASPTSSSKGALLALPPGMSGADPASRRSCCG